MTVARVFSGCATPVQTDIHAHFHFISLLEGPFLNHYIANGNLRMSSTDSMKGKRYYRTGQSLRFPLPLLEAFV